MKVSMDDFEIEIQSEKVSKKSNLQRPAHFVTIGKNDSDDVGIYIEQRVYEALEVYALSDSSTELGAVLLGDYFQEFGKVYVFISDYIEAKYTTATAFSLTFTHETWEYVHREHDSKYGDKKIVGWQHTHPGYGIFLSSYDFFIQKYFFDMPFQVAYVIDPVQNMRGFFQWKHGEIVRLNGYCIYDGMEGNIKIE